MVISFIFLPTACEAFSLDTVNIIRKYSSLLDVPLSYALSSCAFTVDCKQHSILQVSLLCLLVPLASVNY